MKSSFFIGIGLGVSSLVEDIEIVREFKDSERFRLYKAGFRRAFIFCCRFVHCWRKSFRCNWKWSFFCKKTTSHLHSAKHYFEGIKTFFRLKSCFYKQNIWFSYLNIVFITGYSGAYLLAECFKKARVCHIAPLLRHFHCRIDLTP